MDLNLFALSAFFIIVNVSVNSVFLIINKHKFTPYSMN